MASQALLGEAAGAAVAKGAWRRLHSEADVYGSLSAGTGPLTTGAGSSVAHV